MLTPHLRGLAEFQHLSYASSLCGACSSVCPVKIDLHHHLLHNRRNAVSRGFSSWRERMAFRMWRWTMLDAGRFAFAGRLGRFSLRVVHGLGLEGSVLDPMRPWTRDRAAPAIPRASFRQLWRKTNGRS